MTKIERDTNNIITKLHEREGNDKAILAALRRSNSILSRQATVVWPLLFEYIKDKDTFGENSRQTISERAIFTALRCYAVFEQGNDMERDREYDNENAKSLFRNLSFLRKDERLRDALDRRAQAVLSTTNIEAVTRSLVNLTKIIKANNSAAIINYPELANDLYNFQLGFESARKVAIKWGREYFWINDNRESNED
ncbi:type I-E CRISPR-associated protein Cse2/CasB [Lactobacillus intestinalis]|uniref:type I-E CRISPR-associated protein Cse2/CasB n=1 Tax=Lactobacillus intestinalis TaxID=151781 RepID=UPI001F5A354E|nr:type I-E CRISPR-associated protein Cse2/CasB [Lactobacillus intestinalis]